MAGVTVKPNVVVNISVAGAASATRQINGVSNATQRAAQKTNALGTMLNRTFSIISAVAIVQAFRSLERSLTSLVQGTAQSIGDFERLKLVIETASAREMRSASEGAITLDEAYKQVQGSGEKYLKVVQNLALTKPISEEQIANTFRVLAGYQMGVKVSMNLTKALTDFTLATGKTSDDMYRMSLALGQVHSKGKLAGEEMRQLTNAGITQELIVTGLKKLYPEMGITLNNFYDKMRGGALKSIPVLEAVLDQLSDYEGRGKDLAKTWAGIPTMFQNIDRVMKRTLFGPAFEELAKPLGEFIELFDMEKHPRTLRGIESIGKALGEKVRPPLEWLEDKGVKSVLRFFRGLQYGESVTEKAMNAISNAMGMGVIATGEQWKPLDLVRRILGLDEDITKQAIDFMTNIGKSLVTTALKIPQKILIKFSELFDFLPETASLVERIAEVFRTLKEDEDLMTRAFDLGQKLGEGIINGIKAPFMPGSEGEKTLFESLTGLMLQADELILNIGAGFGAGLTTAFVNGLGITGALEDLGIEADPADLLAIWKLTMFGPLTFLVSEEGRKTAKGFAFGFGEGLKNIDFDPAVLMSLLKSSFLGPLAPLLTEDGRKTARSWSLAFDEELKKINLDPGDLALIISTSLLGPFTLFLTDKGREASAGLIRGFQEAWTLALDGWKQFFGDLGIIIGAAYDTYLGGPFETLKSQINEAVGLLGFKIFPEQDDTGDDGNTVAVDKVAAATVSWNREMGYVRATTAETLGAVVPDNAAKAEQSIISLFDFTQNETDELGVQMPAGATEGQRGIAKLHLLPAFLSDLAKAVHYFSIDIPAAVEIARAALKTLVVGTELEHHSENLLNQGLMLTVDLLSQVGNEASGVQRAFEGIEPPHPYQPGSWQPPYQPGGWQPPSPRSYSPSDPYGKYLAPETEPDIDEKVDKLLASYDNANWATEYFAKKNQETAGEVENTGEAVEDFAVDIGEATKAIKQLIGIAFPTGGGSGYRPTGVEGLETWNEVKGRLEAAWRGKEGDEWFDKYRQPITVGDEGRDREIMRRDWENFDRDSVGMTRKYEGEAGVGRMMQKGVENTIAQMQADMNAAAAQVELYNTMLASPEFMETAKTWAELHGIVNIEEAIAQLVGTDLASLKKTEAALAKLGKEVIPTRRVLRKFTDETSAEFETITAAISDSTKSTLESLAQETETVTGTVITELNNVLYGLEMIDGQVITYRVIGIYEEVGGSGGSGSGGADWHAQADKAWEDYGGSGGSFYYGQKGLYSRVYGAGSGDIIPFNAMVEPGEIINIIPKSRASHMNVTPGRSLVINTGDINNGMDLAVLQHNVVKWAGESLAG